MGFGSKRQYQPPPEPKAAGAQEDQLSSAQEAVPLPWMAGQRRIAVKWISRVYNQFATLAPAERPGKK